MAGVFVDTSTLVRRYDVTEIGAHRIRSLCAPSAGHVVFIAQLTRLEVASALNRKVREGIYPVEERDRLWRRFRLHERLQYRTIALDGATYGAAERLLFTRTLTAADAIQVASGLRVAGLVLGLAGEFQFCTADRQQAIAAGGAGLRVDLIG